MGFSEIIIIVSHLPILLAVIYVTMLFKGLGAELKIFSLFIYLSGAVQFLSLFFWFLRKNNMPVLHFYVPAGFLCLAWFYRALSGKFVKAGIIWSTAILFLLFSIFNSLFIQPIFTFNSYALTAESLLIVIVALFTFNFLLNRMVKESVGPDIISLTWINSGLFIYYSSNLLIFYFGAIIMHKLSIELSRYSWILHSFFSIVMYTCFLIGLWKRSKI